MKKIKVFFEATPLIDKHISGVGKVLQETLKALDNEAYAARYEMYVFVPFDEYKKAKQRLNYRYIKLKLIPFPHKVFSLLTRLKISLPIDIFLGRGVYVFENFRNFPVVFSKSITYIHDISFKIFPDFVQEANLKYLQKHINIWLKRTDAIVTVSESSRQEMLSSSVADNIYTINNAVDAEVYSPRTEEEVSAVRSKWRLVGDYCIFIGNIEPRKNLVNTIKAFSKVSTERPGLKLVLIGGGGWRNEDILAEIEKARAKNVEIIRPDGYVPDEDLPALISGARALLQVSWHEGFGLPVLQAIACGTPVVASDIAALKEASFGNEDLVEFCDPASVDSIAAAISTSIDKPHKKQQPQVATWDDTAGQLANLIDSLS